MCSGSLRRSPIGRWGRISLRVPLNAFASFLRSVSVKRFSASISRFLQGAQRAAQTASVIQSMRMQGSSQGFDARTGYTLQLFQPPALRSTHRLIHIACSSIPACAFQLRCKSVKTHISQQIPPHSALHRVQTTHRSFHPRKVKTLRQPL